MSTTYQDSAHTVFRYLMANAGTPVTLETLSGLVPHNTKKTALRRMLMASPNVKYNIPMDTATYVFPKQFKYVMLFNN